MITIDASVIVAAGAPDDPASIDAQEFLGSAFVAGMVLHQPTLTVVEVSAAVARRTRDPELARDAGLHVLSMPGLVLHDLDVESAGAAAAMAGQSKLRAADAIYAATAARHGSVLVTLDDELLARSAPMIRAMTPRDWLDR
jgi:predicted nucleic acid-binding protein